MAKAPYNFRVTQVMTFLCLLGYSLGFRSSFGGIRELPKDGKDNAEARASTSFEATGTTAVSEFVSPGEV